MDQLTHEELNSIEANAQAASDGPWVFRTFDGRLPIVMRHKMPHGEADTFSTSIFVPGGSRLVSLDWGYGSKMDEANAKHIITANPVTVRRLVEQARKYLAMTSCQSCGKPATCSGQYSGEAERLACDECCGHGNEDGWCEPFPKPPEAK